MNKKVLVIAAAIILIVFGIASCPSPATNNTMDASFENFPSSSESINTVDVYFDASISMRAYFASGDGQVANVVSRFEKIGNYSKMFLIGKNENVKPYAGYSTDLQNSINLFDGGSTHFEKLIPMMCDKSAKGKLAVLVTDGIVFINKNASTALEQFQNILSKSLKGKTGSKAIAMFKYSAKFISTKVGKDGVCYYDMFDTPKKLDSNKRPFYVIAVGTPEDILALQKNADLKPELQLYYGIDKKSILQNGKQNSPDSIVEVDPAKDIVLRMTLPKTIGYLYDSDKDFFNHSAAKLLLYGKQLKDTLEYTTNSVKSENGINVTITIKSPANTGIGTGMLTYTVENAIPSSWNALSVNDDSSQVVLPYRDKTFGLEYLLKGIKDAFDGNNPLIKVKFEYK